MCTPIYQQEFDECCTCLKDLCEARKDKDILDVTLWELNLTVPL